MAVIYQAPPPLGREPNPMDWVELALKGFQIGMAKRQQDFVNWTKHLTESAESAGVSLPQYLVENPEQAKSYFKLMGMNDQEAESYYKSLSENPADFRTLINRFLQAPGQEKPTPQVQTQTPAQAPAQTRPPEPAPTPQTPVAPRESTATQAQSPAPQAPPVRAPTGQPEKQVRVFYWLNKGPILGRQKIYLPQTVPISEVGQAMQAILGKVSVDPTQKPFFEGISYEPVEEPASTTPGVGGQPPASSSPTPTMQGLRKLESTSQVPMTPQDWQAFMESQPSMQLATAPTDLQQTFPSPEEYARATEGKGVKPPKPTEPAKPAELTNTVKTQASQAPEPSPAYPGDPVEEIIQAKAQSFKPVAVAEEKASQALEAASSFLAQASEDSRAARSALKSLQDYDLFKRRVLSRRDLAEVAKDPEKLSQFSERLRTKLEDPFTWQALSALNPAYQEAYQALKNMSDENVLEITRLTLEGKKKAAEAEIMKALASIEEAGIRKEIAQLALKKAELDLLRPAKDDSMLKDMYKTNLNSLVDLLKAKDIEKLPPGYMQQIKTLTTTLRMIESQIFSRPITKEITEKDLKNPNALEKFLNWASRIFGGEQPTETNPFADEKLTPLINSYLIK